MADITEDLKVLNVPVPGDVVLVVDLDLPGVFTDSTTSTLHESELLTHDKDEEMVEVKLLVLVHVVEQDLVNGLGSANSRPTLDRNTFLNTTTDSSPISSCSMISIMTFPKVGPLLDADFLRVMTRSFHTDQWTIQF